MPERFGFGSYSTIPARREGCFVVRSGICNLPKARGVNKPENDPSESNDLSDKLPQNYVE